MEKITIWLAYLHFLSIYSTLRYCFFDSSVVWDSFQKLLYTYMYTKQYQICGFLQYLDPSCFPVFFPPTPFLLTFLLIWPSRPFLCLSSSHSGQCPIFARRNSYWNFIAYSQCCETPAISVHPFNFCCTLSLEWSTYNLWFLVRQLYLN